LRSTSTIVGACLSRLPGPKTNEYTYDLGGNLTSFTDAGGTVAYVYNGVNNVTQIIEPGAQPIVLDYHDDTCASGSATRTASRSASGMNSSSVSPRSCRGSRDQV
jgi:YD repeat-containing protein